MQLALVNDRKIRDPNILTPETMQSNNSFMLKQCSVAGVKVIGQLCFG